MKREPGYYWVKVASGWMISKYYGMLHCWWICGTDQIFDDSDFDEINETRLTSPAESQGENTAMQCMSYEAERWPPVRGMENQPLDTTGKWFNVKCQKCGWTGSSEFLDGGGQIADTGDYGDTYCPNCGQVDPDDYIAETSTPTL